MALTHRVKHVQLSQLKPARPPTPPPEDRDGMILATVKSSFTWPRHWRAVIKKIVRERDVNNYKDKFIVYPLNPEWEEYVNKNRFDDIFGFMPQPYLPPITFDDIEELDRWARVASRIR